MDVTSKSNARLAGASLVLVLALAGGAARGVVVIDSFEEGPMLPGFAPASHGAADPQRNRARNPARRRTRAIW
jgi:hypothetical protein